MNAMPASSDPWAMARRRLVSFGRSWVCSRLRVTSSTACSACLSVSRLCARDTNASIACVSASSPLAALSHSGMVVKRRGSITEISGTSVRLMIVILMRAAVSVTTANWDTSAPVPEVEGTITVGGIGCTTLSTPSKPRIRPPLPDRIATPFAASMHEPPPSPTITSLPLSMYHWKAASISWSLGLGVTSCHIAGPSPPWRK